MDFLIQSAYATSGATPAQPSFFAQMIFPIAIFAIFYFLIIRPQTKRNKQHKALIDALSVGNEVVFAGGLIGTIKKLEGDYMVVALNNSSNNDIKVQRASVITVLPAGTIANI